MSPLAYRRVSEANAGLGVGGGAGGPKGQGRMKGVDWALMVDSVWWLIGGGYVIHRSTVLYICVK